MSGKKKAVQTSCTPAAQSTNKNHDTHSSYKEKEEVSLHTNNSKSKKPLTSKNQPQSNTPSKPRKKLAPFGGKIKSSNSSSHRHHTNRSKAKSLSPKPNNRSRNHPNHYYPHHRNHHQHSKHNNNTSPKRNAPQHSPLLPTPMAVIVNRVDLFDSFQANGPTMAMPPGIKYFTTEDVRLSDRNSSPWISNPVLPYKFEENDDTNNDSSKEFLPSASVAVIKVPMSKVGKQQIQRYWSKYKQNNETKHGTCKDNENVPKKKAQINCADTGSTSLDSASDNVANPHPSLVHDKYWAQRHRLFSRFDKGIKLDSEGWYSVTPEVIADHVAKRLGDSIPSISKASSEPSGGIVILDAFSGMGGNSIAFGKLPSHLVSLVVCVDVDRAKLRMVAHNASIYNIPPEKLLLIESNTLLVMDQCYSHGCRSNPFVKWRTEAKEKKKNTRNQNYEGQQKDDLESIADTSMQVLKSLNDMSYNNIKIRKPTPESFVRKSSFEVHHPPHQEQCAGYTIGGLDMLPPFIDTIFMDPPWGGMHYGSVGKNGYDLKKNMKINYYADLQNISSTSDNKPNVVDGFLLLKMAAKATKSKYVIYDIPRNTNKESLGNAALAAGYRGNIKLEEHYLNGRLKTMTAYLGNDSSDLLNQSLF